MNIATRTDTALPGRDGAGREQQAGRPRRSWTLFQRMSGQYWRMARRRRVLAFICQMFRDDLTIYPLQYEETVIHLTALRRAAQKAQEFYRGLDPQSMKQVQPWGTIAKLADFESQVAELLLCVAAMQEASIQGKILLRVQMHVVIRELFQEMLTGFEDVTSQLRALLEKAKVHSERGGAEHE